MKKMVVDENDSLWDSSEGREKEDLREIQNGGW